MILISSLCLVTTMGFTAPEWRVCWWFWNMVCESMSFFRFWAVVLLICVFILFS